jgi:hypothetical protein
LGQAIKGVDSVLRGASSAVKPGLAEIRGVGAFDKALEMREDPLLSVVARPSERWCVSHAAIHWPNGVAAASRMVASRD